jgi:hypothetical protein
VVDPGRAKLLEDDAVHRRAHGQLPPHQGHSGKPYYQAWLM